MMKPINQAQISFDSRSVNESFGRAAVAAFLTQLDPTVADLTDMKTAVSEAVTNAVIHGYQNHGGKVRIGCSISGNELTVTVQDQGTGIADLKKAMEPMYTTDQSGERSGMGFSFMEAFMDHLEVESCPGKGTTVRMKKRIGG